MAFRNRRGRWRPARLVPLLWLGALGPAGCGGPHRDPPANVESRDRPFRSTWLGHDHNDLTEEGLPMLGSSLADAIGDANEDMDKPGTERQKTNEFHMDNCRFVSSFDTLRAHYTDLLEALDPAAFEHDGAVRLFGRILHATQDFVSHSNWIEHGQTDVVNGRGLLPPAVEPGSTIGELVILQHGIPSHWVVSRGASGVDARKVMVSDGATARPGLVTGTYDNLEGSVCPAAAEIPHGGLLSQGAVHTYLAKDDPDSFLHEEAVALGIRQTTEEFCRLDRMVTLRYGEPGAAHFRRKWGVNAAKLAAACPNNAGLVASVALSAL